MRESPVVKMAGIMGRYSHCDPLELLKTDYFGWRVRMAAYTYATEKEKAENEAAERKKSASTSSRPYLTRRRR